MNGEGPGDIRGLLHAVGLVMAAVVVEVVRAWLAETEAHALAKAA